MTDERERYRVQIEHMGAWWWTCTIWGPDGKQIEYEPTESSRATRTRWGCKRRARANIAYHLERQLPPDIEEYEIVL